MLEEEGGERHRGPRRFRNPICLPPATSEKQDNSALLGGSHLYRQMEKWEFLSVWINQNSATGQTGLFGAAVFSYRAHCAPLCKARCPHKPTQRGPPCINLFHLRSGPM